MPQVGFKPTITVFERAKTVHASDCAAIVIGLIQTYCNKFIAYLHYNSAIVSVTCFDDVGILVNFLPPHFEGTFLTTLNIYRTRAAKLKMYELMELSVELIKRIRNFPLVYGKFLCSGELCCTVIRCKSVNVDRCTVRPYDRHDCMSGFVLK
jgi:hypothetical protein